MSSMNRLSVWIGAVSLVVLSAACSNTADGMKQDAEENQRAAAQASDDARVRADAAGREASDAADRAGSAISGAVRDAREKTGDAAANLGETTGAAVQTMDVKAALIADRRIDASNINVDTDAATRTVTLKGYVPNAAQKTVAEEIASVKAEGYKVRNNLRIGGNQ